MLMHSNRVIIFFLAECAQCTFCMQEENPETEMRGRELPGGGDVVAVDSGCVVVAGSVSNDGEKETREMLQCLSSSLSIFCFLAPFSSVLPFFGSLFFSVLFWLWRCWWRWQTGESWAWPVVSFSLRFPRPLFLLSLMFFLLFSVLFRFLLCCCWWKLLFAALLVAEELLLRKWGRQAVFAAVCFLLSRVEVQASITLWFLYFSSPHLSVSSSIFWRWWCCRGWLGGTVALVVVAGGHGWETNRERSSC